MTASRRKDDQCIRAIEIDQHIRARMAAGPFTFQDLQKIANTDGLGGDNWRRVDKLIQKRRKAGEIGCRRSGRAFIWHEVAP